jgi:hypothetical protein
VAGSLTSAFEQYGADLRAGSASDTILGHLAADLPLHAFAELTTLTPDELIALKNPDIIAIDQSGSQPSTAVTSGSIEAVIKSADGGTAALFAW